MTTFVLKYSRHLSINYHVLQFERNFVDLQYSLEQITSYLEGLILNIWIYTCKHTHTHMCVCAKSLQSCPTLCGHMVCSFYPWDSPGENTGLSCHALLQGIFLIQRRNLYTHTYTYVYIYISLYVTYIYH